MVGGGARAHDEAVGEGARPLHRSRREGQRQQARARVAATLAADAHVGSCVQK